MTAAADTVTSPPVAEAMIPTPLVSVAITVPVAAMDTAPVPLETALIPAVAPVTVAAAMATFPPRLSLTALIPCLVVPVTVPLTLIEIAPPPELTAAIPLSAPLIALPFADWVNAMPPLPPVCDSANAIPPVLAAVCASSVTVSAVAPLALRDWDAPIWLLPLQVNAPCVPDTASHSLV